MLSGAAFTGDVRLTKNPAGICQLSRIAERGNSLTWATRMELRLGRDTTKADDNTIPVCTVTAFKEGDGHRNSAEQRPKPIRIPRQRLASA
jgi:hypothetical protein